MSELVDAENPVEEFEEEVESNDNDLNQSDEYYNPKSEFSKPLLVQEAVSTCIKKLSMEMKKGYWNEKWDANGNITREWKPDARDEAINAIKTLRALLYPEIFLQKEGKTFSKVDENIKKKIEELIKKCSYKDPIFSKDEVGNNIVSGYKKDNERIPYENEVVWIYTQNHFEQIEGGWNFKREQYINELVEIYRELFGELNNLIYNLGYYKPKFAYG